MDSQALAVDLTDGVLTLRLDRPEARNALTESMLTSKSHRLTELVCLLERVEKPVVAAVNSTDDYDEGRNALLECRPPMFRGT